MHLTENFKQAFLSLSTNKLRSILTMLGIIMGVFSVVAILAISNAAKVFMLDEFNKMGANSIIIQNMSSNGEELEERDRLTMDDLYKIKEGVAEVEFVTAAQVFYSDIRVEDGYQSAYVTGATMSIQIFKRWNLYMVVFFQQRILRDSVELLLFRTRMRRSTLGEQILLAKK